MSLPVREFSASGYRSLQRIAYPMSHLDVFVGANGAGKSNLYRALELLRAAAANTIGRDIAAEGLDRAMWAGARKGGGPSRMTFAVDLAQPDRLEASCRYEIEIGYPPPVSAAFELEPHVKVETLRYLGGRRPVTLMSREGPSVMVRGEDGRPAQVDLDLLPSETALGRLEDPAGSPMLEQVRRTLLAWRFYHDLRTDPDSPLRQPCIATATPDLASDGRDLAAVFATLAHIRQDTQALDAMVERAFPGAELVVPPPERTASFGVRFPDFPYRVFQASELSDGTLRFLGLAGALMAYRLPPFIALNEPEASLHPDLMEPLGRMIVDAASRTQVWLVTHSERLAQAIEATGAGAVRTVVKRDGATTVEGLTLMGTFHDE
jgi:predicted ATPase